MNRQEGFTLVELMIVVAIIAVLLAIAIPGILRSRMSANHTSAAASMRTAPRSCIPTMSDLSDEWGKIG